MSSLLRVGHLVSGGGTTMEHVARQMMNGELGNIRPSVVIADRVCGALDKAKQLGIPTGLIQKSDFDGNLDAWDQALRDKLEEHRASIVFQNGWIPMTPRNLINRYDGSLFNQHPGPLSGNGNPDFGGKGMCGTAVTAARILYLLESGEKERDKLTTESTIHMVTAGLEKGHLVRVEPHNIAGMIELFRDKGISTIENANDQFDTFGRLVRRVQEELLLVEHVNVGKVLSDRAEGRRTRVDKDARATTIRTDILERVKAAAIKMYPTK